MSDTFVGETMTGRKVVGIFSAKGTIMFQVFFCNDDDEPGEVVLSIAAKCLPDLRKFLESAEKAAERREG